MTGASANQLAPPATPSVDTAQDSRGTQYFPAHFAEHLNHATYGLGIDPETYRDYMRAEIERGREIVKLLQPWTLVRGLDVLDVGCGFGGLLIVMHEAGAKSLSGMEIDATRVHWAGERMKALRFPATLRQFDICRADAIQQLGTYDLILAQDVIEHVSDPRATIQHISRLLRPGGFVYMQVGNKFSPDQLAGDHHYKLPGITLLSRPQAIEYFCARLKLTETDYAVGTWREEKYYRNVFAKEGVTLQRVDRYKSPDNVTGFAKPISELLARLEGNLWPDLRPELGRRMTRRIRKLAELYVHASRQLPQFANNPRTLEEACDAIVGRLLAGVWRFVGTKRSAQ